MKKQGKGRIKGSKNTTKELHSQITRWKDPHSEQDTQYGRITYRKWCEKEIKRMGKGEIRINHLGYICIAGG